MTYLIGITGVPGTGKSFFARSARDLGKTAVALTDPKEATFYGPDATVFADYEWRPHAASFDASALTAYFKWLDARMSDDSKFVVTDTGSELSDLAMHDVLKMHRTNDPRAVEYGRAYTAHDAHLKACINEWRRLVARGKTVIVTFHGQMKELEGQGEAKQGKSMSGATEWQFEEQMLPAIGSSFRQRIHSAFDLWLYTKPTGFGPGRKYLVTAQADSVRPAKHSVLFKEGVNQAMLPNTLRDVLGALQVPAQPTPLPK